jgi:[ribosomal protein S5]-alanine N-acetyltransferase
MSALMQPILTPRLRLEPVTPALASAARAGPGAFADTIGARVPEDWRHTSLALVARAAGSAWGPAAPTRVVAIHRSEGAVVGDLRFEPPGPGQRELGQVEIGYSVAASRRRQGYAVEAGQALIGWLFAEAGAETILAGCDQDNLASIRTLRRLGFWLDSNPGRNFWWVLHKHPGSATSA